MRSAQSGDCVLPPAGARRYEANHRGIEGEHQAQCARVRRWREEHTLVKTQDGKLGITIQDPPPESGRRTHLLYFTHSFCILSCVWKLATSLLVLRYYGHLFLFSMLILHVTSSRFYLYLLNVFITLPTHFHMHIQRHTHTSTHVQSAHKRNGGDNQAQEPGWERLKRGFVRDLAHTHTKKKSETKPIFTNLKERIRAHRASSKATRLFLTK